jgi:hypothetical protein
VDDQRRAPARALVPRTERQMLVRAAAAELSFVRAIITLALPIAVGSWNLRFGLLLAIPCIAYFSIRENLPQHSKTIRTYRGGSYAGRAFKCNGAYYSVLTGNHVMRSTTALRTRRGLHMPSTATATPAASVTPAINVLAFDPTGARRAGARLPMPTILRRSSPRVTSKRRSSRGARTHGSAASAG